MKLGIQFMVCWMVAVSVGGVYAGASLLSTEPNGQHVSYETASIY